MAEFVQQSVEQMLPELEQMSRVGLFTEEEIRVIIKKRTSYEYKLRRQTKQKADFLQYIQYELNLLALVKKRRQKTGYHFKKAEIDAAIKQRIHRLFRTICFRYQEDCKLWLSHIDFCKHVKENTMVSRLFTRMLQVHNTKSELWILAAKWEMEKGLSMENSRRLLQRGLRFNPLSQTLWKEYFRMELLNADKLRKRRELLGLAGMEEDEDEMTQPVLEGQVAHVVYSKAVDAFPGQIQIVLSCLAITQLFDFTTWLENKMYEDLEEKFPDHEMTWDALAHRCLRLAEQTAEQADNDAAARKEVKKGETKCFSIYESALERLNTERMWGLYLEASLERLHQCPSSKGKRKAMGRTLRLFERACEQEKLEENLFATWLELLSDVGEVGKMEEAMTIGVERHPSSVQLWKSKLRHMISNMADYDKVKADLDRASEAVPPKQLLSLWIMVIEYCVIQHPDHMDDLLQSGQEQCRGVTMVAKERQLEWAGLQKGLSAARKVYSRLSKTQPISEKFFTIYIDLEMSQLTPKLKRIRDAYEDALSVFGASSPDFWLDYIKLEIEHPKGRPEAAGQIHWRAMSELEPPHSGHFSQRYSTLEKNT